MKNGRLYEADTLTEALAASMALPEMWWWRVEPPTTTPNTIRTTTGGDRMKKNPKLIAILAIATIAVGGAAWLSAQPAVGEGLTIHVMRAPT